jgi:hypothetical protein
LHSQVVEAKQMKSAASRRQCELVVGVTDYYFHAPQCKRGASGANNKINEEYESAKKVGHVAATS